MASSSNKIRVMNRGGFLTAYIIGQPYGEMNPKEINEIYDELEENVVLMDRSNIRMNVQFNGSLEHPQFVNGWPKVGPFFGYPHNKFILMTYVGQSRFVLDFLPLPFDVNKLPNFHSYKLSHDDPVSFDVTLTEYMASGSQLTLKKDFAQYIRASGFKELRLFGPQGDEFECKLLIRNGKKKATKIGQGWMDFIDFNGFVEGDKLNFKFLNKFNNNVMKVMKV